MEYKSFKVNVDVFENDIDKVARQKACVSADLARQE